ncbi:uncharacterized protein [Onthophagus taurus]|uniref:uncharacterized protein isoform X2 n=1 Tax=Onthophagus taurus TaxID=166361 RepID=UPI000C1FF9AD|nr:uncharacterized protein LOC111413756 isoform X2 [Onthophagus taurus]
MHRKKSNPDNSSSVGLARSSLSVSAVDYYLNLPITCPPSPAMSSITLTPGRSRNIDQDMEALRVSRQDNPFIKQIIASRESLADNLDDNESDNANLVSRELNIDLEVDPFSLPEMHEHMIRSPPPASWPRSPNRKVFSFPDGDGEDEECLEVEVRKNKGCGKMELKNKYTSWDGLESISPLRSFGAGLRSSDEDEVRLMSTSED